MENTNKQPTPEQIAAWREKYGKVFTLQADEEINGAPLIVVARKPSRSSFERFQDEAVKKGPKAMQQFVRDNVLFPDRETLTAVLEDKPGLIPRISDALADIMGVSASFTVTES